MPVSVNSTKRPWAGPGPSEPVPCSSPGPGVLLVRIESVPPPGVKRAALRTRFQTTCISRAWSPLTWWSRGGEIEYDIESRGGRLIAADLHAVADRQVDVDRLQIQYQCPAGDPRHVQEVVDQSRFELDVSLDHFQDRADARVQSTIALFQERRCGEQDGSQRGSQLVAEHREEAVLGPVGRLGLRAGYLFGGEQTFPLLFVPPVVRHIPENQDHADDLVLMVFDRRGAVGDRSLGPVAGDQGGVIGQARP